MKSYSGLESFMKSYFRYISDEQVRRYLHLAGFDLPLAVRLVNHDRRRRSPSPPRLLPDGGRMKAALRVAAVNSRHPAPDELAGFMKAQFPAGEMTPIMEKLQGRELLTADDVMGIRKLVARQWPPYPPQVRIDFLRPPIGLGLIGGLQDGGGGGGGEMTFPATVGEDGRVALITIGGNSSSSSLPQLGYISDVTYHSESMDTKLSKLTPAAPPLMNCNVT
uniref:Uncharacterized protein n=1 Tax=Leersia perrieri TaxID=77586 RepID=A0A0D9WT13_9ORYZ